MVFLLWSQILNSVSSLSIVLFWTNVNSLKSSFQYKMHSSRKDHWWISFENPSKSVTHLCWFTELRLRLLQFELGGRKRRVESEKGAMEKNGLRKHCSSVYGYQLQTWINCSKFRWQWNPLLMCAKVLEGLLQMSVPQSKVAVQLRLNVLCWCTSEACKYPISAIAMAAAMTSCSSAILGIERFTSAFARKIYEHWSKVKIQTWSLELCYQNF